MKRLATILTALGLLTSAGVASAWEFTPGAACQSDTQGAVYHGWSGLSANQDTYVVCPVTRTYSSVGTARADVSNPGGTVSGWVNFTTEDGNYSDCNYNSTDATGAIQLSFPAIENPTGQEGFVTFDLNLPAGAVVRGFHSN